MFETEQICFKLPWKYKIALIDYAARHSTKLSRLMLCMVEQYIRELAKTDETVRKILEEYDRKAHENL